MPARLDRPLDAPNVPQPVRDRANAMQERAARDDANTVVRPGDRPMLFAATSFARSVHALQRAHELATRRNGELYVLHVAAPEKRGHARSGHTRSGHTADNEVNIARAVLRSVQRFCERSLPLRLPGDHMLVRQGEFAEVVAHTARELDAELVVIPGAERQKGKAVARIAREAQVPVLVARRAAHGGPILAATDLSDPGCSELQQAARLAQRLPSKLAFLHNVRPLVHASSSALGHCMCTVIEPSAQALAECRAQLSALAAYFGVRADSVVSTRPSAEDAILETARANGADVIVVGARRQSWLERLFGTALAARVVDRCERSVLVAPIRA